MWNNKIPTLQELLKTNPVGWPTPQPNTAGNITVKHALDTLLCKLDARKIPYDPTVKKDRWEDIKETPLGEPPSPNNVQAALDGLVENLESSDITYRSSNCGDADNPTVRSLLGIQANSDIKLSDLLNRILCELNATAPLWLVSAHRLAGCRSCDPGRVNCCNCLYDIALAVSVA